MKICRFFLFLVCVAGLAPRASATQSIARDWNEQCLSAIRIDTPHPPAQARNLFSLSAVMYDAWAAYDTNGAVGFIYRGKQSADDIAAARHEAISYAAFQMLKERYAYSRSASNTLAALNVHMLALGYQTNNFSTNTSTPAGVGNSVYLAVSAWFINDGSRQTNGTPYPQTNSPVAYPDYPPEQGGYQYYNPPLVTGAPGISVLDVNRWQRLAITNALDQTGGATGPVQNYLGAQWLGVRPFALARTNPALPWIDPGPPPKLNGTNDALFRSSIVEMIRRSSELTPDDGVTMDISPGAFGNNSLGANDGHGHATNPVTELPYATNVVKRADFARCLAEFWADGPNSETPPGHWNVLANGVSDYPGFIKRLGGVGPVLDDLEWDVKVYFALNAGVHDAACACWSIKRFYEGWRPISGVRYMAQSGQSSVTNGTSYHTNGLPLIPDLIELVTQFTAQAGGRHAGLPPGKIAIFAWPGQPADPTNQHSGVKWIRGDTWLPYQRKTFVTPAFPGYMSGHSTFSRAGAEVLASVTGTPFFPGGMGIYNVVSNSFLTFEQGPSQTVQLQWATYYDAADQAGLSRIWGGIHPSADDLPARRAGSQAGLGAWALAQKYFDGSITNTPIVLTQRKLNANQMELRYETLRGFFYQLQSTANLNLPFTNEPSGSIQALDSTLAHTNAIAGDGKFFRVQRSFVP